MILCAMPRPGDAAARPLVTWVRCRTVAKVDSTGFDAQVHPAFGGEVTC